MVLTGSDLSQKFLISWINSGLEKLWELFLKDMEGGGFFPGKKGDLFQIAFYPYSQGIRLGTEVIKYCQG